MTDTPKALDELHSDAAALATRIDALTDEWEAVDEVDTNLGTHVQNAGIAVMALLDEIAKVAKRSNPLRTWQLSQEAVGLHEATESYERLDEHDTAASIDIFDRLSPP
ncbi:hypothetical protein ACWDUL_33635 [Nocardia niigatensis]